MTRPPSISADLWATFPPAAQAVIAAQHERITHLEARIADLEARLEEVGACLPGELVARPVGEAEFLRVLLEVVEIVPSATRTAAPHEVGPCTSTPFERAMPPSRSFSMR